MRRRQQNGMFSQNSDCDRERVSFDLCVCVLFIWTVGAGETKEAADFRSVGKSITPPGVARLYREHLTTSRLEKKKKKKRSRLIPFRVSLLHLSCARRW